MKSTQPDVYDDFQRKINGKITDEMATIPKPSFSHFLKILPSSLKCKLKRMKQDACKNLRSLQINMQSAIGNQKAALEDLFK